MTILPDRVTERLVLRELDPSDAVAFHAFESDPQVVRYMTYQPHTPDETRLYVDDCIAESGTTPRRLFELAIVRREDRGVIGRTGLKLDADRRQAMLWYALHRSCWRKGYALEATRSMLALGFDELALHRIYADIDPRNTASARLCERLGLRREAHFRENIFIKGEWCDTWIYALVRGEWPVQ
jgi:ribosomal-protein-alanine N-acetyltransferase